MHGMKPQPALAPSAAINFARHPLSARRLPSAFNTQELGAQPHRRIAGESIPRSHRSTMAVSDRRNMRTIPLRWICGGGLKSETGPQNHNHESIMNVLLIARGGVAFVNGLHHYMDGKCYR